MTLVLVGAGMGLAMAPATDSIMGSLPPERAGVGSAVNDTTREIGGALGVAILGSITSAAYAASITGTEAYRTVAQSSPQAATAMADSIGGAAAIAAQAPAQFAGRSRRRRTRRSSTRSAGRRSSPQSLPSPERSSR